MNRKLRPTKFAQQIKDEQISLMLGEIENDIEKFKVALNEKDKQWLIQENTKSCKKRILKSSKRKQTIKRIYNNKQKKKKNKDNKKQL